MKQQQGATLIVALILLAIVTLVGAAGMRGTNLEMKMIASARDRAMAFEAAEAALRIAEADLISAGQPSQNAEGGTVDAVLSVANIRENYTSTCTGGKCFKGSYDPLEPYKTCKVFNDGETDFSGFWESEGNYTTQEVKVTPDTDGKIETKYVVEFMCFTIKERGLKGTIDDKDAGDENLIYMPLFRITAFAEGLGKRAKVMAQSMVKVNIE